MSKKHDPSRREFVKKAAYVAPAIVSLTAVSSFAKAGSVVSETPTTTPRKKPKRRR